MFVFYLERSTLGAFLLENGGADSKNYEFLVALILIKFFEKKFGKPYVAGFKLFDKHEKDLHREGNGDLVFISKILQKMRDQDTDVDLIILEGTLKSPVPIAALQLKRIGIDPKQRSTQGIVDFLNSLSRKYPKSETMLFCVFEINGVLDLKTIEENFNKENFPFSKIMFLTRAGTDNMYIGEIWPNRGVDHYSIRELVGQ